MVGYGLCCRVVCLACVWLVPVGRRRLGMAVHLAWLCKCVWPGCVCLGRLCQCVWHGCSLAVGGARGTCRQSSGRAAAQAARGCVGRSPWLVAARVLVGKVLWGKAFVAIGSAARRSGIGHPWPSAARVFIRPHGGVSAKIGYSSGRTDGRRQSSAARGRTGRVKKKGIRGHRAQGGFGVRSVNSSRVWPVVVVASGGPRDRP